MDIETAQLCNKHYKTVEKGILDVEWELNKLTDQIYNVRRKLDWLLADAREGQTLEREVTWDGKVVYNYTASNQVGE